MSAGEPAGLTCPLCGEPPVWLLGGGRQAFCGSEDCKIVTWNPTRTVDENLTEVSFIDLSSWAPRTGGTGTDAGSPGPCPP